MIILLLTVISVFVIALMPMIARANTPVEYMRNEGYVGVNPTKRDVKPMKGCKDWQDVSLGTCEGSNEQWLRYMTEYAHYHERMVRLNYMLEDLVIK